MKKSLDAIFDSYKCDKGSLKHFYHTVYEPELSRYKKSSSFRLLEVGIFKGAGLASWNEFFPKADKFIGVDIFTRIKPQDVPILKNQKIEWIEADSIIHKFDGDLEKESIDVIIDDGLHTPIANAMTFHNLIPFLKKDGVYFIEDVFPLDIMTKEEWTHHWIRKHSTDYTNKNFQFLLKTLKDYNVQRFDLRKKTGEPDSYLFKITHSKTEKK